MWPIRSDPISLRAGRNFHVAINVICRLKCGLRPGSFSLFPGSDNSSCSGLGLTDRNLKGPEVLLRFVSALLKATLPCASSLQRTSKMPCGCSLHHLAWLLDGDPRCWSSCWVKEAKRTCPSGSNFQQVELHGLVRPPHLRAKCSESLQMHQQETERSTRPHRW